MTDARLLKAMQVAKSISQANAADGSNSSQITGYTWLWEQRGKFEGRI